MSLKPSTSDTPSVRILVAGACHVDGYRVGREAGFPACLQDRLRRRNWAVEMKTMSLISIKELSLVADVCKASRPDVLILQLGNFESVQLFQKATSRLGLRKVKHGLRRHPPKIADVPEYDDQAVPVGSAPVGFGTRLIMTAKDLADTVLGRCLLDSSALEATLRRGLALLAPLPISATVMLSPLPCLDPMTLRYRRQVGKVMKRCANVVAAAYVDLLDGTWSSPALHWDHTHLGTAGHRRLAEDLDTALLHFGQVNPAFDALVASRTIASSAGSAK
jgi:lysophospholipase L1-like esterase